MAYEQDLRRIAERYAWRQAEETASAAQEAARKAAAAAGAPAAAVRALAIQPHVTDADVQAAHDFLTEVTQTPAQVHREEFQDVQLAQLCDEFADVQQQLQENAAEIAEADRDNAVAAALTPSLVRVCACLAEYAGEVAVNSCCDCLCYRYHCL